MAALVTEAKPRQLQVSRIRQEEEESWISSEELHTDGSSDDEATKHHHHSLSKAHHFPHHHHPHHLQPSTLITSSSASPAGAQAIADLTASEPAPQDAPHLTETTRRLSELGLESVPPLQMTSSPDTDKGEDDITVEQEHIMLWRPKRGSLKFPHIDYTASESTGEKLPGTSVSGDTNPTAEEKQPKDDT